MPCLVLSCSEIFQFRSYFEVLLFYYTSTSLLPVFISLVLISIIHHILLCHSCLCFWTLSKYGIHFNQSHHPHLTSSHIISRHTMSHHTASSHVSSHHLTPPHLIHPSPLCTLFPIINDATLPLLHFFPSNFSFKVSHFFSLIIPSLLSSFLALPCLALVLLICSSAVSDVFI